MHVALLVTVSGLALFLQPVPQRAGPAAPALPGPAVPPPRLSGPAPTLRARPRAVAVLRAPPRRPPRPPAACAAWLKGSIGEGPNHSNYSDQSSVRIRSKFRNLR